MVIPVEGVDVTIRKRKAIKYGHHVRAWRYTAAPLCTFFSCWECEAHNSPHSSLARAVSATAHVSLRVHLLFPSGARVYARHVLRLM